MAISRFSTSSVAQGLPKYQKLWDGVSAVFDSDYELITRTVVGSGGTSSVTFSSIPSTYKHLQLRVFARATYAGADSGGIVNFNSDSGSNYRWHRLYGDGAGLSAGSASTAATFARVDRMPSAATGSNVFGAFVIDILDYKDTNKYKTIKSIGGYDGNGLGWAGINSALWLSTSAISSITIANADSSNLVEYSSIGLYGIKGAS